MSLDASQLSEEQIEYICRHCLSPMLEFADDTKRNSKRDDVLVVYANAQIAKIGEIFVAVGYWSDDTVWVKE